MSDNQDYLRVASSPKARLTADATILMLKGAGFAALACTIAVFGIWAIYGIGKLLPEESRDTEDPTPFSYNLVIEDTDYA